MSALPLRSRAELAAMSWLDLTRYCARFVKWSRERGYYNPEDLPVGARVQERLVAEELERRGTQLSF